ncbi:YdcF family protein [Dongshaea marina]|uniref:YdcF family protein n=1 Tax=Dongshaea marina TaxID=2047966 RepID=UPI00190257A2|nr:YdcF family protein [Dongshaea marina]
MKLTSKVLLLGLAGLATQAWAAHTDYEDKPVTFESCARMTQQQQALQCYLDYAVSHHYFYNSNGQNDKKPVLEGFKRAHQLAPGDINIANSYAYAHFYIGDLKGAIRQFEANYKKFGDFQSGFPAAMYLRASGHEKQAQPIFDSLLKNYPEQTRKMMQVLGDADQILKDPALIRFKIPEVKEPGRFHAIVVLGYQLDPKGLARPELTGIMAQALKVAQHYPDSKLIVTGGVPRNGRTEAQVMKEYFVAHGIAPSRVIPEELAIDTVQNAIYSAAILKNWNIKEVTIVTRAGHIRRGSALLEQAADNAVPWNIAINSIAWKDLNFKTEQQAKQILTRGEAGYIDTYRDVYRIYYQAFPGFIR